MKVISVINFKGGVGKTTVSVNLGYSLAKNYKVLLIDLDGQGNLGKFLGVESTYGIINSLENVIENKEIKKHPINQITKDVNGCLDVITCNISKENFFNRILPEIARETILKRYTDIIKQELDYDYILIDNAPSVNLDFQNSLVASDGYLIVTEAEIGSMDGISVVNKVIDQMRRFYNPNLKSIGIIINKVDERTNLHKYMKDVIKSAWSEQIYIFNQILPKSVICPESQLSGQSIISYAPNSRLALSFNKLTDEFIKRIKEE